MLTTSGAMVKPMRTADTQSIARQAVRVNRKRERLFVWKVKMTKKGMNSGARRAAGILMAGNSEFDRLFNTHKLRGVTALQKKFGLPLASKEAARNWLGYSSKFLVPGSAEYEKYEKRTRHREQLFREIGRLVVQMKIPEKFIGQLVDLVFFGTKPHPPVDIGFPELRVRAVNGDDIKAELAITPETDIESPLVLDYIRRWQEQERDPLPQPIPLEENPRKLDWRPVWEWEKRHPGITRKEIAIMLNRNGVAVRRALVEIDHEHRLGVKPRGNKTK